MYIYANYSGYPNDDPSEYDAYQDFLGPQQFAPHHCSYLYDFYTPQQNSPLIVVIGNQSNITDSYLAYFMALKEIMYGFIDYKPAHFKDAKEFDEYIASPNYKTEPLNDDYVSVNYPGVCIGL